MSSVARIGGALALAGAVLSGPAGCSAVNTVAEVGNFQVAPDRPITQGLAYYLPKNLVRVTFVRSSVAAPQALRVLLEAREAHARAQQILGLAAEASAEAERQAISAGPSVAAELRKVADLKAAALGAAKSLERAAAAAAKKAQDAYEKIVSTPTQGRVASDSLTIVVEPATADTRYRFVLQDVHLATQDSAFRFAVNERGLLQIAASRVQDRLPEIANNASRATIAGVVGYPPGDPAKPIAYGPLITDEAMAAVLASPAALIDVAEGSNPAVQASGPTTGRVGPSTGIPVVGLTTLTTGAAPTVEQKELAGKDYLLNCPPMSLTERLKPSSATWLIDPQRLASIAFVNCELQKLGTNLRVRVLAWPDARASGRTHRESIPGDARNHAGIVYRASVDYKIAVVEMRWTGKFRAANPSQFKTREKYRAANEKCQAANRAYKDGENPPNSTSDGYSCIKDTIGLTREENNIVIPNGGALRLLPFRYSICSIAGYQVQFVDGQPVRQTIDHRSELAACSAIPLQIMNDIFEAPIKAFDFTTRKSESERKALKAQEELEKARRIPGANPAPPPTVPPAQ